MIYGGIIMKDLELLVTLWPSFPHFGKFAQDKRLSSIRLNTAMVNSYELEKEFSLARSIKDSIPLYFDIKGRQLRVEESMPYKSHLELKINHPVSVKTPTMVLFKAGADRALLKEVKDGNVLIFDGGPSYLVNAGESFHIRHPSLEVSGPQFTPHEIDKIEKAKKAGFDRFFLSYTQSQKDVDEFRDYIGKSELFLKIEDKKGLAYVANDFKKDDKTSLMAARGDLYVELDRPHQIIGALKLIADKDPRAAVGSRILLSTINDPVPSCADFCEMAWLYDIGYKRMMLCDELCLKDELLSRAINAFESFRQSYAKEKT
jgi:pyruvate kinase